jgi:hypothetical protein
MAKQTVYVQLKPKFADWRKHPQSHPYAGKPVIDSLTPIAITKTAPTEPRAGCVVLELELEIDDGAFYPLQPKASVVVPVNFTPAPVVTAKPITPTVKPKPPKAYQQV